MEVMSTNGVYLEEVKKNFEKAGGGLYYLGNIS